MNKIHRVFFHELGHYVARELNHKYFAGTGSKEILIYPCELDNNEYCGHITPNRPFGVSESDKTPVPLCRLAEHLASDLYGCIFQSYYLNLDLEVCTSLEGNGNDDIRKWAGSLSANKLSFINKHIYLLSIEHLEFLRGSQLLDPFMSLNPNKYLIELENKKCRVDLDKLHEDISHAIEEHFKHYKAYVEKHQIIINKHLP